MASNTLSVPQQVPLNLDSVTGRSVHFNLGDWTLGAVATNVAQNITSGASATVSDNTSVVYINPSVAIATFSLTMPANPIDGDIVKIVFGGTIAAGSAVISTTFTLTANTGQTLFGTAPAAIENSGVVLIYQYDATLARWVRLQ